jgi:hypothetical protein
MPQMSVCPPRTQKSYPFMRFPRAGQRHAIDQQDRNVPLGAPMRCLCEVTHPRGPDGDMKWLWPHLPALVGEDLQNCRDSPASMLIYGLTWR